MLYSSLILRQRAALLLLAIAGCNPGNPGIGNYDTVWAGTLARGAAPSREGVLGLRDRGFKTIVDLRAGDTSDERQWAADAGLAYHNIPCDPGKPSNEKMSQFLAIANDPSLQPVFVHCSFGKDRTGTAVAVYRMVQQNWDAERAVRELHQHEGLNALLYPQLPDYLRALPVEEMRQRTATTKPTVP